MITEGFNYTTIVFFFLLFVISYFIHRFLYVKSTKYNIKKANQNAERWSPQTKPMSGGIAFFLNLLISSVIYLIFEKDISSVDSQYIYIGFVLLLAFLMGFADDIINTPPLLKIIVQLVCAIIIIKAGIIINISSSYWFNVIFTVFWIAGIMNSLNMLDNMDAIATLTSITIISGLIIQNIIISGSPIDLFVLVALLASLLSFLFFNWHPSKMYMGDNGSQLLGAFLATYSIIYFWNCPVQLNIHHSISSAFIIFLIFLVPLSDSITVTINRLSRGRSPFVGGRDHTTHFFSYRGIKERQIAAMYFLINLAGVSAAILIINLPVNYTVILSVVSVIFSIFVLLSFFINTRITKPK